MKILRRSFFATLLAPLIARWMPKPKSILDTINEGINPEWDGTLKFCQPLISEMADTQRKLLLLQLAQYHYISYECAIGMGFVNVTEYWRKGHAPFVVIPPIEKYPWEVS